MFQVDANLSRALLGGHEMVCQVDVFDSDGPRALDVPIEAGSITASLMSNVCRNGALTVSQRLTDRGLFDPLWDKVRISTGVPGMPLVPIFTGRVQDTTLDDDGSATITLADFGDDLVNAPFEKPWVARSNRSVLNEMVRMIQDVDPAFTVNTSTVTDGVTPTASWNDNRSQALDELATAIDAIWQTGRTGGFIVYPNPYRQGTAPSPAMMLSDGPSGTLTSFREVRSRGEVYNSITLEVQRADGGEPIRVTVRDERANSKTRWGGKFGKRNRRLSVQTPYSSAVAQKVARRILGQSLALAKSWELGTPHFPLLDPGDVIGVTYGGQTWAQVVESITYPLLAIDTARITTREMILFNDDVDNESSSYYFTFANPIIPTPAPPVVYE